MAVTIFENIRVFDGEKVIESANVTVKDGVISSVSDANAETLQDESEAAVIDGSGKTVLPGLIEGHMHAHLPPGKGSEILKPAIACGITTCCDLHNRPDDVKRIKADCAASPSLPDLKSAYYAATIKDGWPKPIVLRLDPSEHNKREVENWPTLTVDNAEDFVLSNKKLGAEFIKLMQEDGSVTGFKDVPVASVELQTTIIEAAHRHGLLVLAHATTRDATLTVLRIGTDGVAHAFRDQPPNAEVINEFKKWGAFLTPTLAVSSSSTGEEQELREHFAAKANSDQLPEETKANFVKQLGMGKGRSDLENAYALVRQLKEAGVDIVAGTDAVPQLRGTAIGPSLIQELWQYVNRCGFTPVEALKSITSVAARRYRFADRGGIAKGLRADLVLVRGDPSSDIEDLFNVIGVWKAGEVSYSYGYKTGPVDGVIHGLKDHIFTTF